MNDSLSASPEEQILFSLTWRSMQYWRAEALVLRKESAVKDTIIALYGEKTGVYKGSLETMRENFEIKAAIASDCPDRLTACETDLVKFKGRANRRAWIIIGGVPVAFGAGMLFASLLTLR